jgi:hypothetical protein
LCSHLNYDSKPINEGLTYNDVGGGIDVEANGIAELVSLRRHEDDTHAASDLEVGAIKIHCPLL